MNWKLLLASISINRMKKFNYLIIQKSYNLYKFSFKIIMMNLNHPNHLNKY